METGQYYHLIYKMGWENSTIARNLLGTTFRWEDLLAYTLGMVLVVMVETWLACLKQVAATKNG